MGPRRAGLHIDPHELINLIASPAYAAVAEEGRQRLAQWIQDSKDPIWFAARHILVHGQ